MNGGKVGLPVVSLISNCVASISIAHGKGDERMTVEVVELIRYTAERFMQVRDESRLTNEQEQALSLSRSHI